MLIVDAYNVLHVTGVLPPELAGLEIEELADLASASRWGRQRIVLVCDGTDPARRRPARGGAAGGSGVRRSDGSAVTRRGDEHRRANARTSGAASGTRTEGGATIHYAGAGETADDAIARMVLESSAPRRLTVVSNDRAVRASARRRGAAVLGADDWLSQLAVDHSRASGRKRSSRARNVGPLTPEQVDAWLRYFGVEP
jgi:hypothetical protein